MSYDIDVIIKQAKTRAKKRIGMNMYTTYPKRRDDAIIIELLAKQIELLEAIRWKPR